MAVHRLPATLLILLIGMLQRGEAQSNMTRDRAVAYDGAIAAIARRQAADEQVAVPGARSILLTRGAPTARAFVLLHGLTDSPLQFAALAQRLYDDGNNVFVPRLPRHGLRDGNAGDLATLSSSELTAFADSVGTSAAGLGDSVIVVGLSLGGTIGAWLAQERQLWRAVLIAPALEPGRIPALLDRPIVDLADDLPNVTRQSPPEPGRPDREPGFSTHAAAEIFKLGSEILAASARVAPGTKRAIILVNAGDRTVKESAAEALARLWHQHGAAVSVFELPDSLHLPHNIIDPIRGREMEAAVLELLRRLSYGEIPSGMVRRLPDISAVYLHGQTAETLYSTAMEKGVSLALKPQPAASPPDPPRG